MTVEYVKQYTSDEDEVLHFVNKFGDMLIKEILNDATTIVLEVISKFYRSIRDVFEFESILIDISDIGWSSKSELIFLLRNFVKSFVLAAYILDIFLINIIVHRLHQNGDQIADNHDNKRKYTKRPYRHDLTPCA